MERRMREVWIIIKWAAITHILVFDCIAFSSRLSVELGFSSVNVYKYGQNEMHQIVLAVKNTERPLACKSFALRINCFPYTAWQYTKITFIWIFRYNAHRFEFYIFFLYRNVASTSLLLIYYVPCMENINIKRHYELRHRSQVASICYKSKELQLLCYYVCVAHRWRR